MNKNVKGLIVVAIVGVLGYVAYKKFILPNSKKVVIAYLDSMFGITQEHKDFVNKADKVYIDSWSKAIMNGKPTFDANGTTYETNGGRAKK
jgi:TctA family transporter